jgi:phosphatidylglycerol---prolipoprotein diacylglyceryl transferase
VIPYRTFPGIDLGVFTLRTFGLFVAFGILVGTWLFLRFVRERGLDHTELTRLATWVVVLGIVGSRLLFVVTHPGRFTEDPLSAFAVWEGGLQFSGAFLVAIVLLWWWGRRHPDVPTLLVSDGVVYGLTPGLIIGRIGCYAVGEHLGGSTSFFLGVKYLGGETREGPLEVGVTYHNTALYEMLLLLPLFVLLDVLRRRGAPPGTLTGTFLLWYGVQRFATDFLRIYDETAFGLTGAQYICIGMVVAGVALLLRVRRSARITPVTDAG